MESLVRSRKMRSCKTNENYRSKLIQILENSKNQPGVTRYRRSMPVAAAAKAKKAASHSHTTVVEQRGDCRMARLKVPGFALVISTGDPAFRFEGSRPKRTMNWQTQ